MKIYTDGSCLKNPGGPGGWAWWCPTTRRHDSGHVAATTNNRMELQAILEAVKALDDDRVVHIHSDSQWALNVLTRRWKAKKNRDLIEAIWALPHWPAVRLSWVRGHNGHPDNEMADRLANAAAHAGQAPDDQTDSGVVLPDEVNSDIGVRISDLARADALERSDLGEAEYAEPLLSVLMGERVDERPSKVDGDRAAESNTILGAG